MALSFYNVEGPWGGEGGSGWTDGTYSGIKSITVRHGDIIDAIQVEYRLKGEKQDYVITAPQHGENGGTATLINMEEDEHLMKIEGYAGMYGDIYLITSLAFTTNKKKYGAYGSEYGDYFESSPKGKIVGLYGRAGAYLDRLGIYAQEP